MAQGLPKSCPGLWIVNVLCAVPELLPGHCDTRRVVTKSCQVNYVPWPCQLKWFWFKMLRP